MSQPTSTDLHVDANLTDFSIAYIQDQTNFIAGRAVPIKPVQFKSNKYPIFNKNDWLRDDAVKQRAPGEGAPRSGFTISEGSYSAEAWWTAVPLSEIVTANADPAIPVDRAATQLVTQRALIRRERLFASNFMATGKWGTDVNGTAGGGTDFTSWDDYSSDPQKDVDVGKKKVWSQTGFVPNKLTVAYAVHQALKRHPLIKDMIKYVTDESVTAEIIARFLEVDEYLVMMAVYSSSNEGAAAPTYAAVNGTDAALWYADGSPALMTPTAAAIFSWTGLTGINDAGIRIDQYYDQDKKEDVVRGEFAFDMKVTGSDLGYFFHNAAAA